MKIRMPTLVLLACLTLACGGGGGATAVAPVATPAARLEPPAAVLPDGTRIVLELAVTPEERSRGLMFRRSLRPDHGMLFLFENPARWSFWMKDTWIALDLVFLDGEGTVVDVIPDVPPCPAEPCPQYVPAADSVAVLEVAAGTAATHGVAPGSRLAFDRVPGYPRR